MLTGGQIPGPGGMFQMPTNISVAAKLLFEEIAALDAMPVESISNDFHNLLSYILFKNLDPMGETNPDNLFGSLVWGWSYLDNSHKELDKSFSTYYMYACIACNGAGFYDTSEINHSEIVTRENLPLSYDWLVNTYGQDAPLQISIGLTLQPQWENYEHTLSGPPIYPAHCHRAEELYMALDPIALAAAGNWDGLNQSPWHGTDTSSYGTGPVTQHHLPVMWEKDMSSQLPAAYEKLTNGDLVYNAELFLHSFHPGERCNLRRGHDSQSQKKELIFLFTA